MQSMLSFLRLKALMEAICKQFHIQENVDLSQYSSFRIGGKTKYFYEAVDQNELVNLLNVLQEKNIPFIILGGGSNCLFADEVYNGVVIRNKMNKICVQEDKVQAESGVTIGEFNSFCKNEGLEGLEMLTRVPGTVGGVVWNNAGAFGKEAADIVVGGKVWTKGEVKEVDKEFFQFSYRHSIFKDSRDFVLLEAIFDLEKIGTEEMQRRMDEVLKRRQDREPKGLTCGSFFRNPQNDFAGRLLEETQAKGTSIGGMQVSQEHANWFLNKGGATVEDLITLKNQLKIKVKEKFDVELQEEIDIITSQ